jgi:hypothetical protein
MSALFWDSADGLMCPRLEQKSRACGYLATAPCQIRVPDAASQLDIRWDDFAEINQASYRFRNSRFSSLPLGFFGRLSAKITRFGTLNVAMFALQNPITSSSVTD